MAFIELEERLPQRTVGSIGFAAQNITKKFNVNAIVSMRDPNLRISNECKGGAVLELVNGREAVVTQTQTEIMKKIEKLDAITI